MSTGELEIEVLQLRTAVRRWKAFAITTAVLALLACAMLGVVIVSVVASRSQFGGWAQRELLLRDQAAQAEMQAAQAQMEAAQAQTARQEALAREAVAREALAREALAREKGAQPSQAEIETQQEQQPPANSPLATVKAADPVVEPVPSQPQVEAEGGATPSGPVTEGSPP